MMLMFAITTALSAGLLFVVQPMVSKTLLPVLGGVPSVWSACLVFFQSMVLLGYGYAHIVASRLWGLRQVTVHLVLAWLGVAALLLHGALRARKAKAPEALGLPGLCCGCGGWISTMLHGTRDFLDRPDLGAKCLRGFGFDTFGLVESRGILR